MKNAILLLLTPFLIFASTDNKKNEYKVEFKGPVKTVTEINFDITYDGSKRTNKLNEKHVWKFNKDGLVTESISYDRLENIFWKRMYDYDGLKLIQQTTSERIDSNGLFNNETLTCKYDAKGHEVQDFTVKNNKDTTWLCKNTCDSAGNIIGDYQNFRLQSSDMKDHRDAYKYDKTGNRTEDISYNTDGKVGSKTDYKYDEKGNCTEKDVYSGSDVLDSKTVYTYNDKGSITKESTYNSSGVIVSNSIYSEFDKYGNWVRKNTFTGDKLSNVNLLMIEYY